MSDNIEQFFITVLRVAIILAIGFFLAWVLVRVGGMYS